MPGRTTVERTATGLTLGLSLTYFLAGLMKLTPILSKAGHEHMILEFPRYVRALQLSPLGIDGVTLRVFVGVVEVFSAVSLLTPLAMAAGLVLKFLMVGAIYAHTRLDEPPYPPMVFLMLLFVLSTMRAKLKSWPAAPAATPAPTGESKKKTT